MKAATRLQLRWVWLASYLIAGSFALAGAAFSYSGVLPNEAFYAGSAAAGFVGALVAASLAGPARRLEITVAAAVVGFAHLTLQAFGNASQHGGVVPSLAEPLSATFVCFAAALAAVRLSGSRPRAGSHVRLVIAAALVIPGACYLHLAVLIGIGTGISEGLAVVLGLGLALASPSLAVYPLQRATRVDLTRTLAVAVLALGGTLALGLFLASPDSWWSFCVSLWAWLVLSVCGAVGIALAMPGIIVARAHQKSQPDAPAELPRAQIRPPASDEGP